MDERGAVRFNTTHVPAGSATGGQFGTSSGGSSAKGGAKAPAKAPAPAHHMSAAHAAEKARLLAQAHKDAHEAAVLEKTLAGLEKQAHAAQAASAKSAAAAKASLKAGHVVHHRKHVAHHAAHRKHHQSLKQKITTLRGRIHALRVQAAGLEKQANAIRSGDSGIPGHLPHQLAAWWEHGEGAAKIRWGQGGDFDRCVRLAVDEAHMDPERAKGFCAERHHAALGIWPATHAAMEKHAGRAAMAVTQRAEMAAASINDLPDSAFAYIEPGGKKDASGRTVPRSLRHFPVHDRAHAANALTRAPQSPFGDEAMPKIRAACKKFGVQMSDDKQPASRAAGEIFRYYPLDDIRVMRAADGEPSGRVVEAYATVFDEPAEIHDQQGHYTEVIDRGAFDQVLARISRSRGGFGGAVRVLFNHGKTMEGVPAPEFQRPIGKALDIRPDGRGLLTRTEYAKKPFAEEILDDIREGRITGQSFVGGIIRSDPELRGPGDKYRGRNGVLATVRRMTLGLREYGPVLYGAYTGAEFLGVRMATPGGLAGDLELDLPEDEESTPEQEGDAAGGTPEDVTSTPRYHAHRLLALRIEEICRETGIGPLRSQW